MSGNGVKGSSSQPRRQDYSTEDESEAELSNTSTSYTTDDLSEEEESRHVRKSIDPMHKLGREHETVEDVLLEESQSKEYFLPDKIELNTNTGYYQLLTLAELTLTQQATALEVLEAELEADVSYIETSRNQTESILLQLSEEFQENKSVDINEQDLNDKKETSGMLNESSKSLLTLMYERLDIKDETRLKETNSAENRVPITVVEDNRVEKMKGRIEKGRNIRFEIENVKEIVSTAKANILEARQSMSSKTPKKHAYQTKSRGSVAEHPHVLRRAI